MESQLILKKSHVPFCWAAAMRVVTVVSIIIFMLVSRSPSRVSPPVRCVVRCHLGVLRVRSGSGRESKVDSGVAKVARKAMMARPFAFVIADSEAGTW
jgi:hypothetical protein